MNIKVRHHSHYLESMASSATASNATLHLGFLDGSPSTETSFGILRASVPEEPSAFDAVHWVFTIDQSGSMNDKCKDGKTKISHIQQTITHIVDFLLESTRETGQRHYVSVVGFSNTAATLCATRAVDSVFVCELPSIVGGFRPSGSTSFEAALPLTSEALSASLPDIAGKRIQRVNVFMTDGNITCGTKNVERLKTLYNHLSVPHVFVGFGTDHSSATLEALADVPRGSHFFIESIENAGMVYGEIIHGCINEAFQNVELRGHNLEIYDFKANKWTSNLNVPNMPSGKDRVWQVRAQASGPSAALHYTLATESPCEPLDADGAAAFALAIERDLPETAPSRQVLEALPFPSDSVHGSPIEIKKYWWRQRSQVLVAQVRELLAQRRTRRPLPNPRALRRQGHGLLTIASPQPLSEKECTDANLLLDSAKESRWNIVELIIGSQPNLVNVRPEPRRFNLIHHAVHQGDSTRVEWLLNAGADPSMSTSDGISCRELAEQTAPALVNLFPALADKPTEADKPVSADTISAELETFLSDLKQYMCDTPGMENDAFMLSLCDDIYVSILGLSSNLGEMFVSARQVSSGNERAYNMQDIDELKRTSTALTTSGAGRLLSSSNTTIHATPSAVRIMRSCSGALSSHNSAPASPQGTTVPNTAVPPPECSVTLRRPSQA